MLRVWTVSVYSLFKAHTSYSGDLHSLIALHNSAALEMRRVREIFSCPDFRDEEMWLRGGKSSLHYNNTFGNRAETRAWDSRFLIGYDLLKNLPFFPWPRGLAKGSTIPIQLPSAGIDRGRGLPSGTGEGKGLRVTFWLGESFPVFVT